ncbi:MAG TPA: hypothetical protein VMW76_07945 [Bacteroidales bacterium]|nr:hypothetical protein [Bacteroidales bacterium]
MKAIDIFSIWNHGIKISDNEKELTPERIESFLRPRIKKSNIPFYINIVTYLCIHLASIIILTLNLGIFKNNPTWLLVTIGMLVLSTAGFIYGIRIIRNISDGRKEFDLLKSIKRKIRFFRKEFEIWLWFCSLSAVILPQAMVTNIDNINGTYPINNVRLYTIVILVIFFGLYLLNKISLLKITNDLKDYYTDLSNNALDLTIKKDIWMKKYRWLIFSVFLLIFLILIASVIAGIIKSGQ